MICCVERFLVASYQRSRSLIGYLTLNGCEPADSSGNEQIRLQELLVKLCQGKISLFCMNHVTAGCPVDSCSASSKLKPL